MSLERADSISPNNSDSQYKRVNTTIKCVENDTTSSSDDETTSPNKIVIDLKKMPQGQYEYYTDSKGVINQILLYMYHTIQNIVYIPSESHSSSTASPIPLKLRRRPYKYDKEDCCYAHMGYGDYKYTYTIPATKTEPEKQPTFLFITIKKIKPWELTTARRSLNI